MVKCSNDITHSPVSGLCVVFCVVEHVFCTVVIFRCTLKIIFDFPERALKSVPPQGAQLFPPYCFPPPPVPAAYIVSNSSYAGGQH